MTTTPEIERIATTEIKTGMMSKGKDMGRTITITEVNIHKTHVEFTTGNMVGSNYHRTQEKYQQSMERLSKLPLHISRRL